MKRIFLPLFLIALVFHASAQSLAPLTVEKIMREPKWMGVPPMAPSWSADSRTLYFLWNPDLNPGDSLYSVSLSNRTPAKVPAALRRSLPSMGGSYNRARSRKIFEKNGDLFVMEIPSGKTVRITNTTDRESSPFFSHDEKLIYFTYQSNLFSWEISTGTFSQCTDFHKGPRKDAKSGDQEKWLKAQQRDLFTVLKQRADQRKASEKSSKSDRPARPKEIYLDEKNADNIQVSADGNFIVYRLSKTTNYKNTVVPNFVTESGFTEEISSRSKVGTPPPPSELMVYDVKNDTVQPVPAETLEGISDKPKFRDDYPSRESGDKKDKKEKKEMRALTFSPLIWSPDGVHNVLSVRSADNKDRWLVSLDPASRKMTLIDHQHDEAWVGGPALGGFFGNPALGWLSDSKTVWFLSEETGYSHLYLYDIISKRKTALTSGSYEVQSVQLSADRKNFYLATNEVHPGEKHFYSLPVSGGKAVKITTMSGANDVSLSPDEKWLAIRHSYSNKPWELYIQENKSGARPQQLTRSVSAEFNSYPWRDPEIVIVPARDGKGIYTRVFNPEKPNGAAVVFVHGAGYLQNAHRWWSSYFREFMFHNLLADQGYTVIDMDYRASSGYGREWRTGIYRFMGGKDLTDNLDGAKWLAETRHIDPKRIGLYGGSYGGFITLMAMFTAPDVFAAGAALRPVTDWAHYNHGYTSAILNEPVSDSLAYARSSPIYYADGLKGALLICHGMVDTNVHFQDAVRLSQRLIELGKDNWELAVYPVEDHGFVEPSSWTDEYKRILKLFDENLKK